MESLLLARYCIKHEFGINSKPADYSNSERKLSSKSRKETIGEEITR